MDDPVIFIPLLLLAAIIFIAIFGIHAIFARRIQIDRATTIVGWHAVCIGTLVLILTPVALCVVLYAVMHMLGKTPIFSS